jgi:hypothetical protein
VGCWVQEARARGLTSALVHNTALWSGSKKEMVCSLFLWGAAEISNLRNNPDRSLCPPPSCPSSNKPQLSTASDISAMDAGHRPTRTLLLPLQPPPPLPPAQPWRPPICSLLRRAIARTLFTGPPARDPGIGSFAGVILWRFTQAVVYPQFLPFRESQYSMVFWLVGWFWFVLAVLELEFQVLYGLSHAPSPFYFSYFLSRASLFCLE